MRRINTAIGIIIFLFSVPVFADAVVPAQNGPFKIEEKLQNRVGFWIGIYSKYNSWEMVMHHSDYPWIIYSVVNTKGNPRAQAAERARLHDILVRLGDKIKWGRPLTKEEQKIGAMFADVPGNDKFSVAANPKMIRGQAGLKDKLIDSFYYAGRYLPRMERVFERFDLPTEIAYLPFVESGFNKAAVSKVGASGIWQFMPVTGKLFLRVDDVVDERNDPMRAAEAAARLMRQNYELLKEWPLAVTAYNHGALGMAKAVREVGSTSLAEIIEKYHSGSFGFASANFYTSFLAALEVGKNTSKYFGDVVKARRLEFDEFVMPHFVPLKDFLAFTEISEKDFRELNPALTEDVYRGKKYIPVGYTVRVPLEVRDEFLLRYEKIPEHLKYLRQRAEEPEPKNNVVSGLETER
jgi:membrane-bound lytic murein transglycosylase D